MTESGFTVGSIVMWRDLFRGRIAFVRPMRVVSVSDELIVCSLRAGTPCKMHSTYAAGARDRYVEDLASGCWSLTNAVWRSTDVLHFVMPGVWYEFCMFFDAATHRFSHSYVNFQEPVRTTSTQIDTFDLCLDIVVEPERGWRWKDEHEFERAIELGVISLEAQRAVRSAVNDVIARIEARGSPLDDSWTSWRASPNEPLPSLSPGWEVVAL